MIFGILPREHTPTLSVSINYKFCDWINLLVRLQNRITIECSLNPFASFFSPAKKAHRGIRSGRQRQLRRLVRAYAAHGYYVPERIFAPARASVPLPQPPTLTTPLTTRAEDLFLTPPKRGGNHYNLGNHFIITSVTISGKDPRPPPSSLTVRDRLVVPRTVTRLSAGIRRPSSEVDRAENRKIQQKIIIVERKSSQ